MALLQGNGSVQHVRVVQDMRCLRDGSDVRNTPVRELAAVSDAGRSSTEHLLSCQNLRF